MKIAVIGGVGSGKSEVLKAARELGLTAVSADEINAEMLNERDYINKIAAAFPNAVKDGKVLKEALSAQVFADKKKRALLNSIAHPEIFRRIKEYNAKNLIVELPLGVETGALENFDEIIRVYAPLRLRLKRLEQRGISVKRALAVMRAQAPPRALAKAATRTIVNNGSIAELKTAAAEIFKLLCF